ncbi:hypothetical protein DP61_3116 [Burkholderia pseudomallei]|uniref:Type II CBASS E2 protein domain-containing protein n=1 Tax=Burkholderia pseudomallei TaxID=28450 RepID=A0AAX0U198_BURPE|nr:hypothetical protein DP61_3116 [Burkholderia pseudomallei]PJO61945.1 hypothetical protein CWD88_33650 [Burkholderia pseudomallei]
MHRVPPPPSLAARALDLASLQLADSSLTLCSGKELRFVFVVSPGPYARRYRCLLRLKAGRKVPDLLVLEPDVSALANGKRPPHTYLHDGPGTKLCLWWPKAREWSTGMKLSETYIPWAVEWLGYFEEWLATGKWTGGGEHPPSAPRRRYGIGRSAA